MFTCLPHILLAVELEEHYICGLRSVQAEPNTGHWNVDDVAVVQDLRGNTTVLIAHSDADFARGVELVAVN